VAASQAEADRADRRAAARAAAKAAQVVDHDPEAAPA